MDKGHVSTWKRTTYFLFFFLTSKKYLSMIIVFLNHELDFERITAGNIQQTFIKVSQFFKIKSEHELHLKYNPKQKCQTERQRVNYVIGLKTTV